MGFLSGLVNFGKRIVDDVESPFTNNTTFGGSSNPAPSPAPVQQPAQPKPVQSPGFNFQVQPFQPNQPSLPVGVAHTQPLNGIPQTGGVAGAAQAVQNVGHVPSPVQPPQNSIPGTPNSHIPLNLNNIPANQSQVALHGGPTQPSSDPVGQFITNSIVKPVTNTVAGTVVEPARQLTAQATNNPAAAQAAYQRAGQDINNSLPIQLGQGVYNFGKAASYAPQVINAELHNQPIPNNADQKGLSALNQSYLGPVLTGPESLITHNINGAAAASQKAGFNPNASIASQVAKTAAGVPNALYPLYGAEHPLMRALDKGGQQASSALRDLGDANRTNLLKTATSNTPVVNMPIGKLTSYEGAPDRAKVEQYKQQIQSGQQVEPLIALQDSKGNLGVEDGKHRFQAYQELGYKSVPVQVTTPEAIRSINEGGYAKIPGSSNAEPEGKPTSNSNENVGQKPIGLNGADSKRLQLRPAPSSIPLGQQIKLSNKAQGEQAGRTEGALTHNTPNEIISPDQYVKELTLAREAARKGESPDIKQKLINLKTDLRSKFLDSFAPIEDVVNDAKRNGTVVSPENNITYAIDRALRADTIGSQYIKDNGLDKIIQNAPDTKALDQYMIAKHAQDLEANGIKTGRNLSKDKQLVDALAPEYEPHAQALRQYQNNLLDKTADYGLISRETAEQLKKEYPNYVPANRIFAEGELPEQRGIGAGKVSISKQTIVQGIKGSTREIESPLASILHKTQDVISQGERNRAAGILASYKDLPGNPFGITPLRTAEKVTTRMEARKYLAQSRPLRNELQGMVSGHKQAIRDVSKEIANLERSGRDKLVSDKEKIKNYMISRQAGDNVALAKGSLRNSTDGLPRVRLSGTGSKLITSVKNPEELLHEYITNDKGFKNILDKMAESNEHVANLRDDLASISRTLDDLKATRQQKFIEGKTASDISSTNKHTFSVINDGIKETYETTPEVAAAAKSLNKEQLGLIGKIFSYPTRVLRLGATSLNPAFSLANLAKDQASALINSSHPLRSSVANPKVFLQALKAASNHASPEYAELLREGAGGTSFDIARDQPIKNIQIIRADKNIGTRAVYQLQHPIRSVGDFITAAENTIGRTEEFTRAQQYFGNKQAQIKLGKSEDNARLIGADAARNNTVNFARAGEYGRVLNSVLPYLNAGVQGSRTLLRNLRERPIQTAAKIAITGFLPTAAATAWNLSDPKRKQAYDSIREYEKQNNIIIVPPNPTQDPKTGRWNVIKIPVSQEIANLNAVVKNGVEAAYKDKNFDFPAMAANLFGTATSLNAGSNRQILNQVTPQAVKPLVENATNQNLFTGNQIVPDAQKNLAPQDQYNKSTSGTAKEVGKVLGISPLQIDNLIRTTTGGLGQNIVNLSDKSLAKAGLIKPSDVKGTPFAQAVTNRFNSAAGVTPGSEYYTALQQEAKDQHLGGKQYELLNTLASKELDANGNPVPTDLRTKQENATIRANNPDIVAVETAAAKKASQQTGQPIYPFYNLNPTQQHILSVIAARKGLDHNDEEAALMTEANKSWIDPYNQNLSDFFATQKQTQAAQAAATGEPIPAPAAKGALNFPTASQNVVDAMNGVKGLTGSDYASYMKQHPELSDYYSKLDQAVRAQHSYYNEPQYKEYPQASPRVQEILNSMPQGSDKASKTARYHATQDPEVNNYLANIAFWQINKAGARNQYEGQDYEQKDLKNFHSIGKYDVVKLPNGQYAQVAGTLSNGQGLAGSGYFTGATPGQAGPGNGFHGGIDAINAAAAAKGAGGGYGKTPKHMRSRMKRAARPPRMVHLYSRKVHMIPLPVPKTGSKKELTITPKKIKPIKLHI